MTVTAPETVARQQLMSIINAEFAPEGIVAEDDRLHESLGTDRPRIGVSPERSFPTSVGIVMESTLTVQFFNQWDKKVDRNQAVSPTIIETFAERFRRALKDGDSNSDRSWYFKLDMLDYPRDPTGNKTRFVATVCSKADNSALLETSG